MNKLYHLSHIDLDGYSCQLISTQAFEEVEYYNANYGAEVLARCESIFERIKEEKKACLILITDVNLTEDEALKVDTEVRLLNEAGIEVQLQLLDHHGTGLETSKKYDWYHLDLSKSATLLTYNYCLNSLSEETKSWLTEYVKAVDAVDLWHQEKKHYFEYGKVCMRLITESRELNRYMFLQEDSAYKLYLLRLAADMFSEENAHIKLDESIHMLKKSYFKKEHNDTLDNLSVKTIVAFLETKKEALLISYKGHTGLLTYALGNSSIIGNAVLTNIEGLDFYMDVGVKGAVSYRANNKVDVSRIAAELTRGGGHPNASGGRFSGFKEEFAYKKIKAFVEGEITKVTKQ